MRSADATLAAPPPLDVLIVGAGLSGIGSACHLLADRPARRIAILEAREAIGGTWDLFRYPGVRSDSDMQTLSYRFRPWREKAPIAGGPAILDYLRETARTHGVDRLVHLGHRVRLVSWSSVDALWTIEAEHDGGRVLFRAAFLLMCGGYYDYLRAHEPDFPGRSDFRGRVVHPQFWPPDLDCRGQRVVVIGSGATAISLAPALARDAAHLALLQRSPGYVFAWNTGDGSAALLRALLPEAAALRIVRARNILFGLALHRLARRRPGTAKRWLVAQVRRLLPPGYDVETHFTPRYAPWDQRVCFDPDGAFLDAVARGRIEMVTGTVDRFTDTGLRLTSGRTLDADVVVTATGLRAVLFDGIAIECDGRRVDPAATMVHRGMMLSGVPNLAFVMGYTSASWTLKADLVAAHLCRVLNLMRRRGHTSVRAEPDGSVCEAPFLELTAGYVLRAASILPKAGVRGPWCLGRDYARDLVALRLAPVPGRSLRFDGRGRSSIRR